MPIRIKEGADPLSDSSRQSDDDGIVINAQSEAGRVLRQELRRYCQGEVNGRSFLIAGHRGAGKTTMVSDAIDRVLRQSRQPASVLMQPLPVFLHGPSLFEKEAAPADGPAPEGSSQQGMAEQARAALTQIILGLHRAVVREFARAYRARLTRGAHFAGRTLAQRSAFAELAAQFELELVRDPLPARLREFWALAEALESGVLDADLPKGIERVDKGTLELVALSGMCEAYQRISGELSSLRKTQEALERRVETSAGIAAQGAELVRPVVSVLSGVLLAGGTAGQTHSAGGALVAGLVAAIASSMFFTRSSTRTESESRSTDTTFIPDLSLKTLDRILPTLLQHLRDAGLAPVLVVDELDKVERLSDRLVAMIHFLKKLVAENVFTCFLTDRGYLEQLRLESRGAYSRSSSYFSHPLLVTFQPADFDRYLDRLLRVDAPVSVAATADAGAEGDKLDLEVLKWVLRFRSELHALSLTREVSLLRGDEGTVAIGPGLLRTLAGYRIAVSFQVALELQLAQPAVAAWLRLLPARAQTLIDALYYPSRCWAAGDRDFRWGEAHRVGFVRYVVERMNLDEEAEKLALADISGGSADRVLSPDDLKLLWGLIESMVAFLGQQGGASAARKSWADLVALQRFAGAVPTQAVIEAMYLGQESLLIADEAEPPNYQWRYRPSGVLRDPPVVAPKQGGGDMPAAVGAPPTPSLAAQRILAIEHVLAGLLLGTPGEEQVFETLAERLRILPTSPAWRPVLAAIARLNDGQAKPSEEDLHTVHGYLEMLDANLPGLQLALLSAAFLAGTAGNGPAQEKTDLRHCLQLLHQGLQFTRLDGTGVVRAIHGLNDGIEKQWGVRVAEPQADPAGFEALPQRVVAAMQAGKELLGKMPRQEKVDAAWASASVRLEKASRDQDPGPATPQELVAAAIKAGPYRILGLDYAGARLSAWTTAIMLAAGITEAPIAKSNEVPAWVIGMALNRLGSGSLGYLQMNSIVDWLLQGKARTGTADLLTPNLGAAMAGAGSSAADGRLALCIIGPKGSPMTDWTARPRTGMALVCTPEQADLLMGRGLLEQVMVPFVVARSGEVGPEMRKEPASRYSGPRGQVAEVWVYRRREPAMYQPAIVDPQDPDVILERAQPLAPWMAH